MNDKKPATIREIAVLAGVSAATVSLVLNRKGDISAATRARVLDVLAKANYVPRPNVRSVAEVGETLRFLKIAKHGHTVNRDHSVFISDYLDAMSAEASDRGYTLEVVSFEDQPIDAVVKSLGFDNLPQSSTMEPSLTTIDVSKRKIGRLAVTILDELVHAREPQPAVKILVGANLISRASTRRANVPDRIAAPAPSPFASSRPASGRKERDPPG